MKGGIARPTPTKPATVIELEGKSHRTKAELRQRKKAEADLLSGKALKETKEVRGNPLAHKEFVRIRNLLRSIGKDDDLYSGVLNRYCLLSAECKDFEDKRENIYQRQKALEDRSGEMEIDEYIKLQNETSKMLLSFDRQVQAKRKMMFDIEKENVMTIASSLRSIPKAPEKKKNALREALGG